MLNPTLVNSMNELIQIHALNQRFLKKNIPVEEHKAGGFLSWLYSIELLVAMHDLAPSVIVKEGENVVGYALVTVKEAASFHRDLEQMFLHLEPVLYKGRPLSTHNYYCMGQICVAEGLRGRGVVPMLYQKHREIYGGRYDFILTEISTGNPRSLKAHERTGFETIHTYRDHMDEWNVVVWDWD
jgi:hypothetical protein